MNRSMSAIVKMGRKGLLGLKYFQHFQNSLIPSRQRTQSCSYPVRGKLPPSPAHSNTDPGTHLLFISAGTTHILHSPRLANTSSCINENQTQRRGGRKYRDEQHQLSRHSSRSSCTFNTQQTGNEKFDFWGLFRHGKALMFRLHLNQLLLRTNYLKK